ncbi:tRNA-dihydrouridine synthase, partial [Candidatus Kaiserbacteria bacterium]|nr:tRNA-dihydrouridine synthase [Candidatus Kaiserbacteria bacterium]
KNPASAKEIIKAAKRGARTGETDGIPVSVKTRLGYNKDELEEWLPALLEEAPAVVTMHARTRKEMSKVPARWERVKRAVEIRNELGVDTLILGNGDAESLEDARQKAALSGADGVMLGRAIFGNPWLFHPEKDLSNVSLSERLEVMIEHTKLYAELLPNKNFATMKKHYKAYVNSFAGAAELRAELMEQNTPEEIERVVHSFLKKAI